MAKTIKFNLICDDKPVRTIEDLQENFSIEDILKYYQNGLLLRWLDVRGYSDEYKKVSAISEIEALGIIKELIRIFNVETDEDKVEEGVYMLQFLEEKKELCEAYKKVSFKVKSIIDDYMTGYKQLVDGIMEHPNDVARIKANIAEMITNYRWVMDLNYRDLFWKLEEISVLAIMCLLMNEHTRKYYLPIQIQEAEDTFNPKYDIEDDSDKREMYHQICNIIQSCDLLSQLGDNLHVFSGVTDGYWKDLETKGKKYMIISMGSGDYVRAAGLQGGDLSNIDITEKFVIIDGIDYKSNSSTRQLLYMEV